MAEVEVHNSFAGPEDPILRDSEEEAVNELDNIGFDDSGSTDPAPPAEDIDEVPPPPTEEPPPPPPPEDLPPSPPEDLPPSEELPPPEELPSSSDPEPPADPDAMDAEAPQDITDGAPEEPVYVNGDVAETDGAEVVVEDAPAEEGEGNGTPPPEYAEDAAPEKEEKPVIANGDTDEIVQMEDSAANGGAKGDLAPILLTQSPHGLKGKSLTICFVMFFFVIAATAVGLAFYFVITAEHAANTTTISMPTTSQITTDNDTITSTVRMSTAP